MLYVFAINQPLDDVRHTHLTRHQGKATALPDVAEWLGVDVDTDRIELFPVKDLAGLGLSSYVATAFAVDDSALGADARRMDALQGHVMLVPLDAMSGTPVPGRMVTQVAVLSMAEPDHSARAVPKSPVVAPVETPPSAVPTRPVNVPGWIIVGCLCSRRWLC
jgi:hypothetical protein